MTNAEEHALAAEEFSAFQGFKLLHLKSQLQEILTQFGRNGLFEEYTKHDITHLNEMLRIYDWLLTDDTKQSMSPADWLLLVCATYLHDLGLVVTRQEFSNRMASGFPEFREAAFQAADNDSQDYRAYLNSLSGDAQDKFLYQEFVRSNHATRIRSWLQERPDPFLGYDPALGKEIKALLTNMETVFITDLGLVCESHHLDDLHDTERYQVSRPYGNSQEETANVQFAAIALRAADLLHITRDRTPSIAFRIINPANPYSQIEWAKQSSVRAVRPRLGQNSEGNLAADAPRNTIEVHAEFTDAEGFFGLNSYIVYVEKQLRQCNAWATHSMQSLATGKQFPWRRIDRSNVKAKGFIAEQFQFTLDQTNILELLTGHTLYNDSGVVVRELVQNSLDAVRLQTSMTRCSCSPQVQVYWHPASQILEVIDNGTGMTQEIIEQNFLRVGASRYQDSSFKREFPGFSPISRFGIGVLSTFMISDEVQVLTSSSDDNSAREISLRSVHGQYLIRLFAKDDERIPELIRKHGHGTTVRIRIRHSAEIGSILSVLNKWVVLPGAEVLYQEDGGDVTVIGFEHIAAALEDAVRNLSEVDSTSDALKINGEDIEVRTLDFGSTQLAYAVSWSPYFQEWSFVKPRDRRSDPSVPRDKDRDLENRLGVTVEGIRVEAGCPGFVESPLLAMANVSGNRAPRTNVARTALEKTTELNEFLLTVYRGYCEHLRKEVDEIISQRGFSATRAASQLQFLLLPLEASQGGRRVAAPGLLYKALHEIPAFLTEISGERRLLSMNGLQSLGKFLTEDSLLLRQVENLLGALPGTATREDVLRLASGNQIATREAEIPVVCGQRWGLFNRMFADTWEPEKISLDDDGTLSAIWSLVIDGQDKWWRTSDIDQDSEISSFVQSILSAGGRPRSSLRRTRGYGDSATVFYPLGNIASSGLERFDGIALNSYQYMLPDSPIFKVDIGHFSNPLDRLSIISALVGNFANFSDNDHSMLREFFENSLMPGHLSTQISMDGLLTLATYSPRIFDVSRWERSFGRASFDREEDWI